MKEKVEEQFEYAAMEFDSDMQKLTPENLKSELEYYQKVLGDRFTVSDMLAVLLNKQLAKVKHELARIEIMLFWRKYNERPDA